MKPKTTKPKPDDPEQSKRFEEAAREHEADTNGEAFTRALGVVAPQPVGNKSKRAAKKR